MVLPLASSPELGLDKGKTCPGVTAAPCTMMRKIQTRLFRVYRLM